MPLRIILNCIYVTGPAPRVGISGPCPPKSLLVPPQTRIVPPKRGLCPKELTDLVLLDCNSRPETPKILVIIPEFMSKNCFFVDFAIKTVCFCGFSPEFMKIRIFTSEFVEFCTFFAMKTRICGTSRIFWDKDLFFDLHPRFRRISRWTSISFGPHSRILRNKVFVHPQICLCLPSQAVLAPGQLCYVDDIFAVFETNESCLKFLDILNSQHKNIKFTIEYGSELMCFLDVLIKVEKNGCDTWTWRKTSHTGLLLNFDAYTSWNGNLA